MSNQVDQTKRILIVDDDAAVRSLLSQLLRQPDYDVTEAHSGEQAVRLAGEKSFDLAFVDIIMPGFNGIETSRLLRAIHPDIRIVLMSGFMTMDPDEAVKESGAEYLLRKEFSPLVIARLAKKLLTQDKQDTASASIPASECNEPAAAP